MKSLHWALCASLVPYTGAYEFGSTAASDALLAQARVNFFAHYFGSYQEAGQSCRADELVVRKEWHSLNDQEKSDYIAANKCMLEIQNKSSAAGARTRWDDFLVAHLEQVNYIHSTGSFLSWHRVFVHAWQTTMRNECGYTGVQPYANWAKIAHDPVNAPLFDGSNLSIGGNGKFEPNTTTMAYVPGAAIPLPHGSGGGCVETGPFANYTINIGPAADTAYNPRCWTRDLLQEISAPALTDANITSLITDHSSVEPFQDAMQSVGDFSVYDTWGVHAAGHFMVSGTPGADFWLSPGDPWFWLHHAMIDRTWWIWQNLKPEERTDQVAGARSAFGAPPNGTSQPTDHLVINTFTFPDWTIGDALSTATKRLCYVYE